MLSKISTKLLACLLCSIAAFFIFMFGSVPAARADGPSLQIVQPVVQDQAYGRPGSGVAINGSGFSGSTEVKLYATKNKDANACAENANQADLTPLPPLSPFSVKDDGTFTATTAWPTNLSTVNTQYYICGIAPGKNLASLSKNTFTVVDKPKITISTRTVAQGGKLNVTGTGWLPVRSVAVAVISPDNTGTAGLVTTTPDPKGNINVTLTIPADSPTGTYSVSAYVGDDQNIRTTLLKALTISTPASLTPSASTATTDDTPTPSTAETPTVSAASTPTATSSNSGNGTVLIVALAGLGVVCVAVGVTLFAVYSRKK